MPALKTTFIPYSCFGYYDEKFVECERKCKYASSCRNATESDSVEDVRRVYKYTFKQIDELNRKWSNDRGV